MCKANTEKEREIERGSEAMTSAQSAVALAPAAVALIGKRYIMVARATS
jgi:hypothetical protein